ncbi:MAG: hypothetical protein K8R85_03570 [Bacteroidetes bacterium]|nr:hypothetical protein [Bacteroidota bacterium]
MVDLTQNKKNDFLHIHLRHRLTLLRTLRERKIKQHNYQDQGDFYRCVKDSNLMGVRLILDFLGLKGKLENGKPVLTPNIRKTGPRNDDDIMIDQFFDHLLLPADVPTISHRTLAGVYLRGDKELAHLTSTFNEEFNKEDTLIEAATAIEKLLEKYLYTPLGEQLPEMDI